MSNWKLNNIDQQLIQLALEEDLGRPFFDATSHFLFETRDELKKTGKVKIISKENKPIVLAGLPVVEEILKTANPITPYPTPLREEGKIQINTAFKDSDTIQPGETLLSISGPKNLLMMTERTILNFLQHLCAIATLTRQFVDLVAHTKTKVLDTRKTLPGFRHLDKYAVHCGGGVNHRMGLYDALMIKDNHIDLLGGMEKALAKLPDDILQQYPVIVEIRNQDELEQALKYGQNKIARVLLDNMNNTQLKDCVNLCNGILPTEASGGVNLDSIASIAETGVDFASVGMLTHSAGNLDLSMKKLD